MANAESGPEWFIPYWDAFRRHSHQLIAWGYEDAQAKIKSKDGKRQRQEEEITGFITEAIQARLRSPNCPRWCEYYDIKEENPVPWGNRFGKRRKRTDIIIEHTRNRRPEYIFESKRLMRSIYGADKYILKGLQRFVLGEYASRYPEAGMIGYVQSNDLGFWMDKIKSSISTNLNGKCKLRLQSPQSDVEMLIGPYVREWISVHKRIKAADITIYHILLDSVCPS